METETSGARALLLDHLPALRDRLAQHDVKIDRFDVDLMQQPGGGAQDRAATDARPERRDDTPAPAPLGRQASDDERATATRPERPRGEGQLNVVI
jgi:flagellar hook-length control protein FliK